MKWTEEQMSALQQIIKTGEAQNLSKEDIQTQLNAKKQEFKEVKTSTIPKSPGVDTENFSGSELDDYFSDSVTEKNAAEPWLNEKPKRDKNLIGPKDATGDDAVKDRARQNIVENPGAYGKRELEFIDKYNPEGLDYDQFKAKLDEQYASRGVTPNGLLSVLDGLKTKQANQKEAIKGYDELKGDLNSISSESYNESLINDYFDLENRPTVLVRSTPGTQTPNSYQPIPIKEYLGEEKYKQYLEIQNQKSNGETLELIPYNDYNLAKIDQLKGVSAQNLRRKTLEFGLRGYKDEKVQGWIEQLVDKNRPYESVEEANESLELSREAIVQTNIDNDANYEAFEKGRGSQIRNKLLEINSSAKEIINRTEEGDLLQQQVIHLLQNQLDYFYNEEEMQSLILSELSENNKLLQYLSSCREELAAPLLAVTDEYFKESSVNFRGISALLVAGIYYLVLQSKKNDGKMCGIDLNTMEGKGLIKAAIKEIIVSAFKEKL